MRTFLNLNRYIDEKFKNNIHKKEKKDKRYNIGID